MHAFGQALSLHNMLSLRVEQGQTPERQGQLENFCVSHRAPLTWRAGSVSISGSTLPRVQPRIDMPYLR